MSKRIIINEKQYRLLVNEINLYHGSKANFDHFDLAYAMTGWGEMAYGRGVYLSDYRDAALEYSNNGYLYTVKVPKGKYLGEGPIRRNEAYDIACKFRDYYLNTEYGKSAYSGYEREWWDTEGKCVAESYTGFDVYGTICSILGSEEDAGKWLRSIGYVGLRQNCVNRNTGFKFHNYVIFDENDVQILSKERQ